MTSLLPGGEPDTLLPTSAVPPDEGTALLASNNGSTATTDNETTAPWPNTYERSIALLSSPILPTRDVARYTKSPLPGGLRRAALRQQHATPDPPSLRNKNNMARVQSLDFYKDAAAAELVLPQHKVQRLQQAQKYRQELLQKQPPSTKTPPGGTATFAQCSFNLANILMGVGLLGLPYVYKVAGYYGGTMCVLSLGGMTWYTSLLIGRTLRHAGLRSFPDVARRAFGNTGGIVLGSVLYFELFSCLAIFLVSMGDHLHQLLPQWSTEGHMTVVAVLSLLPTIVLRTPALLSYLSMVGTLATTAVVLSVLGSAVTQGNIAAQVAAAMPEHGTHDDDDGVPYHVPWRSEGLTLAFGLVAYCFSGHAIIPSIYTSMERPQDFEKMVTYTFALVIACCLAVATSGYYMFGSTVQDQVTLSLQRHSSAVLAMKGLTWLMILTAFSKITLTMFPLALGIEETVAPYLTSERMVEMASAVIKLCLTVLALAVAIFCPSFSFLCSFVGLICTMAVSVIFPAAAHWKLFGPARLTRTEQVIDALCIVLGLVMAVAGTAATLYSTPP